MSSILYDFALALKGASKSSAGAAPMFQKVMILLYKDNGSWGDPRVLFRETRCGFFTFPGCMLTNPHKFQRTTVQSVPVWEKNIEIMEDFTEPW